MTGWIGIDRVTELELGRGGRGRLNVPNTLSIFDSHFPRFAVLPGVVIIGAMTELARLVMEGDGSRWRLRAVEQVRFRHYALPGDELELSVEVERRTAREAVLKGSVRAEERVIATVRRLRLARSGDA
jgi:3-hydroxyacyl-[acyl-carrier-protein] dehydratase